MLQFPYGGAVQTGLPGDMLDQKRVVGSEQSAFPDMPKKGFFEFNKFIQKPECTLIQPADGSSKRFRVLPAVAGAEILLHSGDIAVNGDTA